MENLAKNVLFSYPIPDEKALDIKLFRAISNNSAKIVVLDDDPTGVQTVHGISVYTAPTYENLMSGFMEENKLFYILTNSRGFTAGETEEYHRRLIALLESVSAETGRDYILISRSDSTLRGHYPLETQVLNRGMAKPADGEILCFFFKEGGRFTLNNTHYVLQDDELVPAGNTEFARDITFGYRSSDLREYVAEKTAGEFPAEDVACVSLEMLRRGDIETIEKLLMAAENFSKIVVNAIDYWDLKVFCLALYNAMAKGKRFLFRSAAGLVKVMGGVADKPLLTRGEMITDETPMGGMIVVGSHTAKTTAQLEQLLTLPSVEGIAFNSDLVLDEEAFETEINRVVSLCRELISSGRTPVCYTSRKLMVIENDSPEAALRRSVRISEGVKALVERLPLRPAFVIAKGGITSSDVGIKALGVQRALVLGQICPGVPVWRTGPESKFPDMAYVIFPGNVGDENSLLRAAAILIK